MRNGLLAWVWDGGPSWIQRRCVSRSLVPCHDLDGMLKNAYCKTEM